MRTLLRGTAIGIVLVLTMIGTAQGATTRIPFTAVSTLIGVPSGGVEKDAGNTWHVRGMVLVYSQISSEPMIEGTMTVTVDFVFGGPKGQGNAMHGVEVLQPSAYPGEWFSCTFNGGWDKDGVMQADDRCIGFGDHLAGWQFRSHISAESGVSGILFRPGE